MAKIYPNERSVGLFKCGKKRCEVCKCVNKIKNFTSSVTQKAFKVNHCFNYDHKCSIYLLMCKKCFRSGPNLVFFCVRQSRNAPFCENYTFYLMQNTRKRD